jgi:hypothetical protein
MRRAVILSALLAACDISGAGQTYPGASLYQSPSRDFHFHYLAPPWRHGNPEAGKLVHLVVDNFGQFTTTDKALTHQVWASYSSEASTRAAADVVAAELTQAGRTITRPASEVGSLGGDRGWQLFAQRDVSTGRFYYRECLFEAGSGKVVRLSLTGFYPLDEQDIDDLVLSFSAGADPGTQVPPSHLDAASRQDAKSP